MRICESLNCRTIQELDQSIKRRATQRIAYRISKRSVPSGVSSGYIRDYTELSLIKHELSKKKRHIPIRQLVRRSGNALLAIKPCFMMSLNRLLNICPLVRFLLIWSLWMRHPSFDSKMPWGRLPEVIGSWW